jgi:hypothetical protein
LSKAELVQHFAKIQKKAKSVAKEMDMKSKMDMTEGKNKISVRHISGIADGQRHK